MSFSFSELSLSNVKASAGIAVLAPGKYVCKVRDVEVSDTKSTPGGKRLIVKLSEINDKGVITAGINLHLPGKDEATRIGLEQLKSLLVYGGHPDPDNIGQLGVASIRGLIVGVQVKAKTYNGEKTSDVAFFCEPKTVPGYETNAEVRGSGSDMDDDIPFANPYRGLFCHAV